MRILVTNDDSIHAPGIALLAKMAMALGDVYVVAPAEQCSAMSQKLSISGELRVERAGDFPVEVKAAYQVTGTPVDCVKVALQYILDEKPDYVFSGINDGYNVGFEIAYSGTVGAALEAVMNGVPAIAFSSAYGAPMKAAEKYLLPVAEALLREKPALNAVWNVNFPSVSPDQVRGVLWERSIAPVRLFRNAYVASRLRDDAICLAIRGEQMRPGALVPEGTDAQAVLNGFVSVGRVKCTVL